MADDEILRNRRRPATTSTSATIAREPFGDDCERELSIPTFIDDYNHNMNSVDLANQLRQAYDTQRIAYRNWIPLLHWVLDQAAINAYKLSCTKGIWTKGHVEFRRELYLKLLNFSKVSRNLHVGPHNRVAFPNRRTCAYCSQLASIRRDIQISLSGHKGQAMRRVLGGLNLHIEQDQKRPNRPQSGCGYCQVALCVKGPCWEEYHSREAPDS
jgi:hypothetical protein